ncbi:MAG: hypothetical protein H6721_32395 [Sandaracinus sp.]|nr:hypothetical protein [Sandaracinus sp.]MCB9618316.1 hypothetical protein [Sandaracinus sp.]MCB9636836.1 hypothetical protein [Sandaracinus sp.]
MGSTRDDARKTSRRKGLVASSTAVATGVAAATLGLVPLTIAGVGASGYLAWRWWDHRAKNGLKF